MAFAVLLSACGGEDSSSTASEEGSSSVTSGGDTNASSGGSELVEEATASLAGYYEGTYEDPPSEGPKAESGKTVWIVVCSMQAKGCLQPAETAEEAAKAMGWNVRMVDGKFTPTVYNQIIRQATASNVDGLILIGVNCTDAPEAMKAAISAGVSIAGEGGEPCEGKEPGYTAWPTYSNGKIQPEMFAEDVGLLRSNWIISKTDGKAKVLNVRLADNPITETYSDAFEEYMERCEECSVESVDVTSADFAEGKVQGKVETALVQNPDANTVIAAFDALYQSGVGAAVGSSGRDLLVIGNDGTPETLKEVEDGEANATAIVYLGWAGYAVADALNRAFAGETGPINEGMGYALLEPGQGIPVKGEDEYKNGPTQIDWRGIYEASWGVGG